MKKSKKTIKRLLNATDLKYSDDAEDLTDLENRLRTTQDAVIDIAQMKIQEQINDIHKECVSLRSDVKDLKSIHADIKKLWKHALTQRDQISKLMEQLELAERYKDAFHSLYIDGNYKKLENI